MEGPFVVPSHMQGGMSTDGWMWGWRDRVLLQMPGTDGPTDGGA